LAQAVERAVLSDTEAESLKKVRAMVLEIIAVDEFESEVLRLGSSRPETIPTSEAA
jgi:hypothetical protein